MSLLSDINALNKTAKLQPGYKLINFEPALVPMLKPRGTDNVFFRYIDNFPGILSGYAALGPAFMACHEGGPICMFGCIPLWEGVAECWLVTDISLPDHARAFHRVTKTILDIFMADLQLVRLQITVHSHNFPAIKWAKVLYFKEEGLLEKFGPDKKDFYMMARTA